MEGDRRITTREAHALHAKATQAGSLVIWTVTNQTDDYGDLYVARPSFIAAGGKIISLHSVLIAGNLEALRDMAPIGTSIMQRATGDDPVILEVWI